MPHQQTFLRSVTMTDNIEVEAIAEPHPNVFHFTLHALDPFIIFFDTQPTFIESPHAGEPTMPK